MAATRPSPDDYDALLKALNVAEAEHKKLLEEVASSTARLTAIRERFAAALKLRVSGQRAGTEPTSKVGRLVELYRKKPNITSREATCELEGADDEPAFKRFYATRDYAVRIGQLRKDGDGGFTVIDGT